MINLTEHFNSPITEGDHKFIQEILKVINKEGQYEFSFKDGLLLLEIKNRVLKILNKKDLDHRPDELKKIISELLEVELKEKSNEIKLFKTKKDDIKKFVQYLMSIKEMR